MSYFCEYLGVVNNSGKQSTNKISLCNKKLNYERKTKIFNKKNREIFA